MEKREIIIIGAGPAGMAAASKLQELGYREILLLEKESSPGGVLRQCIHTGFGLKKFGKNMSGPEYSAIYEEKLGEFQGDFVCEATVLNIEEVNDELIVFVHTSKGEKEYAAQAVILASGCRETGRGMLEIAGSRPAGIYTAGTAQALMNLHNLRIGKTFVIVGSGDIGLIMARRITLEGGSVLCVVEKEKICGGLERNYKECIEDFEIPLITEAQVCEIRGDKRVESVLIRNNGGIENVVKCDTVILSAGLIPEDRMAHPDLNGLFYCGNVLYVHDLVDDVSECAENVAMDVAGYLLARKKNKYFESMYSSKQLNDTRKERKEFIRERRQKRLSEAFGSDKYIICTLCPNGCRINLSNFSGGKCDRGAVYAENELKNPRRIFTSSVKIENEDSLISVRTDRAILRANFKEAMKAVSLLEVKLPIRIGDVILADFIEKGCNLIATGNRK